MINGTEIILNTHGSGVYQKLKSLNLLSDILESTSFLDEHYIKIPWSQRFWHIKNGNYVSEKCVCGNNAKWDKSRSQYVSCNSKCKNKKIKQTNIKTHANCKDEILEKSRKTNQKLYGVDDYQQSDQAKKQTKQLNIQKFAQFLPPAYKLISYDYPLKLKHLVCGNEFKMYRTTYFGRLNQRETEICPFCNPLFGKNISDKEIQLQEFIQSTYSKEIQTSVRNIISPYELDIYIPEYKLTFEFNGSYFHSENFKDEGYHKLKSDLCDKQGVKLVHVWEHDWEFKTDIIKSIISGYFGKHKRIYARKCKIVELKAAACREFINDNHLQGFVGATVYYGLIYDLKLVSVMSFQKHRDYYEISRLCTKLNLSIIGGAERLWKHFLKNNEVDKVITYSNRDYFTGKIYERLGFELEKITESSFWYSNGKNILSRQQCQKHKLIKQGYDPNKTAREIMLERGYYRCYSSGNFLFKNNPS